jgi:hypothetical protein
MWGVNLPAELRSTTPSSHATQTSMATSAGRDGGIPGTAGPAGTAASKDDKVPVACLACQAAASLTLCCLRFLTRWHLPIGISRTAAANPP